MQILTVRVSILALGLALALPACQSGLSDEASVSGTSDLRVGDRVVNFLVQDGFGNEASAKAYYLSNGPEFVTGSYTLTQWKAQFIGTRPTNAGLYRNANELGLWRQMTCTKQFRPGDGGCFVVNFASADTSLPNKGTVAMTVSPAGFTRFFVFDPQGILSPTAILDDEGPKFVPQLCTTCHAGQHSPPSADLGSIFREFQPSQLERRPGITAAAAELEWFDLNQSITSANSALASEATGGAPGIDHAKEKMLRHVKTELYASTSPIISRGTGDPALIPPSWTTGTPRLSGAKQNLWRNMVNPFCMGCHRTNSLDFSDYASFEFLASQEGPKALLLQYLQKNAADPERNLLPFMPQSKLTYDNFRATTAGPAAAIDWIKATNRFQAVAQIQFGQTLAPTQYCTAPGETIGFELIAKAGDRIEFTVTVADAPKSPGIPKDVDGADGIPQVRLLLRDAALGGFRPVGEPAVNLEGTRQTSFVGIAAQAGTYDIAVSQTARMCVKYTVTLRTARP